MMIHTLTQCLAVYVDSCLERGESEYQVQARMMPDVLPELDITELVRAHLEGDIDARDYSNSCAVSGLDNIGEITWQNAIERAIERPLLCWPSSFDEVRDYYRAFGAWSDEEIDAWTGAECNAMVIQEAASRINEAEDCGAFDSDDAWGAYYMRAIEGRCSEIMRVETGTETRYYIYIGI